MWGFLKKLFFRKYRIIFIIRNKIKKKQKLLDKIPEFVARTEETFGLTVRHGTYLQLRHLKRLRRQLKGMRGIMQLDEELSALDAKTENAIHPHGYMERGNPTGA